MPFLHRYLGNPVLSRNCATISSKVISAIFIVGCAALKGRCTFLNLHITGMEFASEMIVKATNRGMK